MDSRKTIDITGFELASTGFGLMLIGGVAGWAIAGDSLLSSQFFGAANLAEWAAAVGTWVVGIGAWRYAAAANALRAQERREADSREEHLQRSRINDFIFRVAFIQSSCSAVRSIVELLPDKQVTTEHAVFALSTALDEIGKFKLQDSDKAFFDDEVFVAAIEMESARRILGFHLKHCLRTLQSTSPVWPPDVQAEIQELGEYESRLVRLAGKLIGIAKRRRPSV